MCHIYIISIPPSLFNSSHIPPSPWNTHNLFIFNYYCYMYKGIWVHLLLICICVSDSLLGIREIIRRLILSWRRLIFSLWSIINWLYLFLYGWSLLKLLEITDPLDFGMLAGVIVHVLFSDHIADILWVKLPCHI